MAQRGGARPGAGRKSVAKELQTGEMARKALRDHFGSLDEALIALLQTGEPSLQKFVFEHAFGKSPDKIEHSGNAGIKLHIVRGKSDIE